MAISISVRPISIAALLIAFAGCSQYKTADVGYSTGVPSQEMVLVKHWYNGDLKGPTAPDNLDWFGQLCTPDMNIWCDANGNWSVANVISNGNNAHTYSMRVDFGRQDNNDPKTFTSFASYVVPPIHCGAHETKSLHLAGAADPAIQSHFHEINAVRPIFVLEDSGVVMGSPSVLWISRG